MRRWWFIILPIIVFIVSFADLLSTLHFEKTEIGFSEANPIARYVWETGGNTGLITFKLAVTLASCSCMGWVLRNKNRYWIVAVSIFGLSGCFLLIGYWIFWFFAATAV